MVGGCRGACGSYLKGSWCHEKHKNDWFDRCHCNKHSQTTIAGDQSLVSLPALWCLDFSILLVNTLRFDKAFLTVSLQRTALLP